MPQLRNISNDTVQDFLTGQVVEPDGVIDVPDALSDYYAEHPVLAEVGTSRKPKQDPPVKTDNNDSTGDSDKEQS